MEVSLKIIKAEKQLKKQFKIAEEIALFNQKKVLQAFINNRIASNHFFGSTGYGYNDSGREKLYKVYAEAFGGEEAIVSQSLLCGSHAITTVLFGLLRPGDILLSITGKLYDTLDDTIFGKKDKDNGSLKDFKIKYDEIKLKNNDFDELKILKYLKLNFPKIIYIQRSCGYQQRKSLNISKIEKIIKKIRQENKNCIIVVDNCYCEFVEEKEPTNVGADIIVGSLIKNPGGGIVSNGGYIVGKKEFVDQIASRFSSPSLKTEVGSFEMGYRLMFQGLFLSPHIVFQAKKGSLLIGKVMKNLGYKVINLNPMSDIVRSIIFDDKKDLINFCQIIQKMSPIDSFVMPIPGEMAGYQNKVIMAAGCFVQGSSIELSCDSPLKKPYTLYIQGGLTYEHVKLALNEYLKIR